MGVINGIFSLDRNSWDKPSREAFDGLPWGGKMEPQAVENMMAQAGLVDVCTEWLDALVAIKQRTIPRYETNRYLVWARKPGNASP